jgi:lactoylglutathione lyase
MKEQVKDRSASGFVHIAFRLGSQDKVIALSQKLKEAGFAVISEPRRTGDGYFESGVLDPEGNYLELTI